MLTRLPLREFDPGARTRDLVRPEEDPGLVPRTALYRFYASDKALLYVGVTGQPIERWVKHRRQARWWPTAAYVSVEIHPNTWQALDAERLAIRTEHPSFNKRSARGGH
ncbi:GIY-YIG nuclease family protein [Streptomyces europaeiscabiei]|uniref:GIY-YIG nuclease family protein n=1 Tax=Streptomyces europaeiscabiei TaxID=146819 RepID=UPI0029A90FCB|nr:GIY-YIG nuclease family protein [Streptomyces europaeiscabiei]MDX3588542.1 GIY-YIG nuclease family protein [Streptomyces europaeiscabiei]